MKHSSAFFDAESDAGVENTMTALRQLSPHLSCSHRTENPGLDHASSKAVYWMIVIPSMYSLSGLPSILYRLIIWFVSE